MSERLAVCGKCAGVNRLPTSRPAEAAKCGSCGSKLFSGRPEDVDAATFDRFIARSSAACPRRRLGALVRSVQDDGACL